jgi:hypothetical protein
MSTMLVCSLAGRLVDLLELADVDDAVFSRGWRRAAISSADRLISPVRRASSKSSNSSMSSSRACRSARAGAFY